MEYSEANQQIHGGVGEAAIANLEESNEALSERLLGGVLYAAVGAYLTLTLIFVSATVGLMVSKLVLAWTV